MCLILRSLPLAATTMDDSIEVFLARTAPEWENTCDWFDREAITFRTLAHPQSRDLARDSDNFTRRLQQGQRQVKRAGNSQEEDKVITNWLEDSAIKDYEGVIELYEDMAFWEV
ncbi:hypothetical protein SLS60_005202 [Paraconiothyrium brasiliense]|uniref:Uncharacterized protein n=1 Tax=Paraconiothyrium brasiliense TaxID=300254 RepID=A0ABR3RHI9_9PLEO